MNASYFFFFLFFLSGKRVLRSLNDDDDFVAEDADVSSFSFLLIFRVFFTFSPLLKASGFQLPVTFQLLLLHSNSITDRVSK